MAHPVSPNAGKWFDKIANIVLDFTTVPNDFVFVTFLNQAGWREIANAPRNVLEHMVRRNARRGMNI